MKPTIGDDFANHDWPPGKRPDLLKVGDLVVTAYHGGESHVIRRIVVIEKSGDYGSGFFAAMDGGLECPHCGETKGAPIKAIDAAWCLGLKKAREIIRNIHEKA